ncbi:hypothetical protein LTR43_002438 [Exophiala xenobiotica]
MASPYTVLGVFNDADYNAIKSAYSKLVLRAHPDKGGSPEAFIQIQQAYEILKDPVTRVAYDLKQRRQCRPDNKKKESKTQQQHAQGDTRDWDTPSGGPDFSFNAPPPQPSFNAQPPPSYTPFSSFHGPGGRPPWQGGGTYPSTFAQAYAHIRPNAPATHQSEFNAVLQLRKQADLCIGRVANMIKDLRMTTTTDEISEETWCHLRHLKLRLVNRAVELLARQNALQMCQLQNTLLFCCETPPAWDLRFYAQAVSDDDKVSKELQGLVGSIVGTAAYMRRRQAGVKELGGMEVDDDVVKRVLEDAVYDMKRFLVGVLSVPEYPTDENAAIFVDEDFMASEVQAKGDGQYNGSLLEILTIVLASISVLVVAVRGVAKHRISKAVESTDVLLPLALVFAVAQSVFVRLAISNGLGSHVDTLTDDQILTFQKLTYAGNLLFQLVLALSQVIVVLLIKNVQPQRPVRIGCNCLLGFITVYSALSLSILAFQCSLPTPWLVSTDSCVDRKTFFTAFIITGIGIDAATLILPIIMMCKVSTSRDKKIFVCVLFGTRLALPLVTAPQIYRLQTVIVSKDLTWDLVSFQLWIQIVLNLAIITASLPSLGKVMWELWAFGSSLRTSRSMQGSGGSRDFGHELGLEQAPPQYQEKPAAAEPYLGQPGPVIYADEKDDWSEQVLHKVREIGSVDSLQTVVGQGQAKDLRGVAAPPPKPSLTHLAPSPAYTPSRRHNHSYRRPDILSPVIERSPYIEGMTGMTPQMASQHWGRQQQQQPRPQQQQESGNDDGFLHPPHSPQLTSGPPSYAASSHYDDDGCRSEMDCGSEFEIDSYYMGNTNYLRQYDPRRTEFVMQSMIEDLQKENAKVDPAKRWEHGWI